jgi:dTMP kinase
MGRLIVVDGTDGSGKATQVALLAERLAREGRRVETITFPRYEENVFGELIGECLKGKRGDFLSHDPRVASTLYAADRFETKPLLEEWLREGAIILADRYVSSNQIHQAGKIEGPTARTYFLEWLDTVEHGIFGMPRPDLILFLDVPIEVSMQLTREKHARESKTYLAEGELDRAEQDRLHQEQALQSARAMVAKEANWRTIQCVEEGSLRAREDIHEEVYHAVVAELAR